MKQTYRHSNDSIRRAGCVRRDNLIRVGSFVCRGVQFMELSERFWSKVERRGPDECWLWQASLYPRGYGQFWLDGAMHGSHRISYVLANGPIPNGLCVCHACDVRSCVNPRHLFLGTQADNMADKVAKGRTPILRGERNGRAKLTAVQVEEIRLSTASRAELARRYGVTQAAIGKIVRRESWRCDYQCDRITA